MKQLKFEFAEEPKKLEFVWYVPWSEQTITVHMSGFDSGYITVPSDLSTLPEYVILD